MAEENLTRPPRFFTDDDLSQPEAGVSRDEAAHALKSRRLSSGARVELFDGKGNARIGILEKERSGLAHVRFSEPLTREPLPEHRLCIAVSPPKRDRMTFLVEKLSELGTDRLLPVLFRRSLDAGVKENTAKISRWKRTTIEAAKQCGRNHFLEVEAPIRFSALPAIMESFDCRILLHPVAGAAVLTDMLGSIEPFPEKTILIVGPEGGFTPEETETMTELGAQPAVLNQNILRTETAALASAAIFRTLLR